MLKTLKPEFAPEWLTLFALAVLDVLWARAIGLHISVTWSDGKLIGLGLSAMLLLRLFWRRGGVMAEYFSLTALATALFGVMSYLSLASSGPLADPSLQAIDRALHFNWIAGYRFLLARPFLAGILALAYDSLVYQALYFCVLFALMQKKKDLREMFWLVLVMGILTSLGVHLFPAFGPFTQYGVSLDSSFLVETIRIKNGHVLNFALSKLQGVVCFPSFHTAMALAYVWGFRNTGAIGWGVGLLNLLMLCAIPWYGGHYLTDMIAGAGVMLAALAIVRIAGRLSLAPLPQAAPAAAEA